MKRLAREPAIVIGFVLSVVGEVWTAVQGLGWEAAVAAALPIVAAAWTRWFVEPTPKERRGFRRRA